MITDPWEQMLLSIEPEYDTYKAMMSRGPRYIPILTYIDSKRVWQLKIHEQWPKGVDPTYSTSESGLELDIRCTWCETQLKKYSEVSRWSWQHWHFKNQYEAEKFITLYQLRWAQ